MSDNDSFPTTAIIVIAALVLFVALGGLGIILGLIKWAIIIAAVLVLLAALAWKLVGSSDD